MNENMHKKETLKMLNSDTVKVAVATKDGIAINLHFGHADVFWIYAVQQGTFTLLEKRAVDKYCHGQSESASSMAKIMATISDCNAVFSAKIGDAPAEKLAEVGICAVTDYAYEAVDESLADYVAT